MKPSFVIIGLGNPGEQYARTRHNAGFRALDVLAKDRGGEWTAAPKLLSETAEVTINEQPVLLVKPLTFMNRSGEAVRKIVDFYKLDPATSVLVVCDDIDLPLGIVRLRESGGPGTHNGLKSVVEHLGEGFARLRIGLGTQAPGQDLAAWVLSVPVPEDQKILEKTIEQETPPAVMKFLSRPV